MAGGQERILRRRIRTVQSTKKITRAFELIAASQIVRAQGRIAGSRPYLRSISEVVRETAGDAPGESRLLGEVENPASSLVLAVVADRGLCGAYNANVLRAADRLLREGEAAGRSLRLVTVGRKAQAFFRFRGRQIESSFIGMSDRPTFEDARTVAGTVVPPFLAEEVDVVQIVSTRFVSAGTQTVQVRQMLPLLPPAPAAAPVPPGVAGYSATADSGGGAGSEAGVVSSGEPQAGFYEFEPQAEDLLELLVPRYAEAAVYGALLEASASEHTARMRAMSAATENADELITTLRRAMNRARQDSITTEIMEIVGGAEALRQGREEGGELAFAAPGSEEHTR